MARRVAVVGLTIQWNVRVKRGIMFGTSIASDAGEVLDLSIWGASISAPTSFRLDNNVTVTIALDDSRGIVKIKSMRPGHRPRHTIYGVEFVELDPLLQKELLLPLSDDRDEVLAARWVSMQLPQDAAASGTPAGSGDSGATGI